MFGICSWNEGGALHWPNGSMGLGCRQSVISMEANRLCRSPREERVETDGKESRTRTDP